MEIELNGQKRELKKIKYLDAVEVEEIRRDNGLRAATKKYLVLTGLTEDEAENLSLDDGLKIQQIITDNSVNFQIPTETEKTE